VFALRSRCVRAAFALRSRCVRDAFALRSRCVRAAVVMLLRCVCSSFVMRLRLRSRCVRDAFALQLAIDMFRDPPSAEIFITLSTTTITFSALEENPFTVLLSGGFTSSILFLFSFSSLIIRSLIIQYHHLFISALEENPFTFLLPDGSRHRKAALLWRSKNTSTIVLWLCYAAIGFSSHLCGLPWTVLVALLFLLPHQAPKRFEEYLHTVLPALGPAVRQATKKRSEREKSSTREVADGKGSEEVAGTRTGVLLKEDLSGVWKRANAKLVNYDAFMAAQGVGYMQVN
jgi:hypothetical protein